VVRSSVRGVGRRPLVVACPLVALAAIAAPIASANGPASLHPVPSLQPKLTQQLWTKLVHRRHVLGPTVATANCRSLRAVFYTESDWLRLATKLAANASPCAQYYISIPPLAANKTNFRPDQPWRIRALGPNFHVLAEISYNGWNKWVTDNASNWHDAGAEARRRMAAQGFDVAAGDSWVVNEFSSGVRGNIGEARQKVRDLVRGLYEGDGTVPQVKGAVYLQGIGQSTTDLGSYKVNMQKWYVDTPFWQDMSAYVSDWSQELYGDVRDYGVAGASAGDRASHLDDFLGHQLTLANVAPPEAATARAFLQQTYNPLANAAWIWQSGFGFTDTPLVQMQDFVSAQTYALRSFDVAQGLTEDRFGFAWAPRMADNSAWTPDFNAQSAQLIDRLAAAIHDSDQAPGGACGTAWCSATVDGAAFVETWKTFTTWSQPALGFTTPAVPLAAGTPSAPLTVQLQTAGVAENAATPLTITLSSSSAAGTFSVGADGPWTSTLDLSVAAGSSSASFYYRDTKSGTATITATASGRQPGTQAETVTAGALASLAISPTSSSLAVGATQTFNAAGVDAYGNSVAPSITWSATGGTISTTSGASTTFTATTSGQGAVTATSGTIGASATVTVTQLKSRVKSITYSRSSSTLYVTFTVVDSSGQPVSGASIGLKVMRSGTSYATGSARTASNGTVTVSVKASRGCYSTTVTGVTAPGLIWDGVTPSNSYCY
jgi:hypothetical protein